MFDLKQTVILVTLDVSSLYTDIQDNDDTEVSNCFLEKFGTYQRSSEI
jgi:hypothetical protein